MKERFLIFFSKKAPGEREPKPFNFVAQRVVIKGNSTAARSAVDPAESLVCSPDGCVVPVERDAAPKFKIDKLLESDGKWMPISLNDLDSKINGGEIILIGASWCAACKVAKEKLPKKYPKTALFYVDFDAEDEDALRAKFALSDGPITLPVVVGCTAKGQYEQIK